MLSPAIPPDVRQSIGVAIHAAAEATDSGHWQRLTDEALQLIPSECHVSEMGFIWHVSLEELPAILSALRVGLIVCKATRNVQEQRLTSGSN